MLLDKNTLFKNYFSDFKNYDEVLKSNMTINPNWEKLLNNLTQMGTEALITKQNEIDWLMDENGVTYNVYNDPKGMHRAWELNIVPFLIHQKEWETIEKGIKQRSELLNLILKDIYGERELIKNGIIPPTINYKNPDPNCDLNYTVNEAVTRNLDYAINNAFGFGGHNTSVIFKKFEG